MRSLAAVVSGKTIKVLAVILVLFAVCYFNLTPFASVDCWWHMKMAEKFLQTGSPVIYDSFAVQIGDKILATYPNLLPGILFVKIFALNSFQGLNIFRIFLFMLFVGFLIYAVTKNLNYYFILLQIIILAYLMHSWVILQPDLFNYLFFSLWIYLLEKLSQDPGRVKYFLLLIILELAWVNSHPLFFYYGLFIAVIYFSAMLISEWRSGAGFMLKELNNKTLSLFYLIVSSVIWLFNPLSWRALQSFFVNMIKSDFSPESTRSLVRSLNNVETWGFLLLLIMIVAGTSFFKGLGKEVKKRLFLLLPFLLVPIFFFERVLPFLFIYLILIQGIKQKAELRSGKWGLNKVCLALVLLGSLFLILDRGQLLSLKGAGFLNKISGLSLVHTHNPPGIAINQLHPIEAIREISIIKSLAPQGNLFTNHLPIASAAVWFCPDKPVYWYGHAAVVDARYQDMKDFLINLPTENQAEVKIFLDKYNISTLVLTNYNSRYLSHYQVFHKHLRLIYIDPFITMFISRKKLSTEQKLRIQNFYHHYRPTNLDKMRFNLQYHFYKHLLLWFGAELTGNNGEYFLAEARKFIAAETINNFLRFTRKVRDSQEQSAL